MNEEKFKRNIAYKIRIGEILNGKPVIENEKFSFLDFNGKRVIRINLVGSIVDKYNSEGEKKYSFLTIDDGSGQIKMKAFGDDSEKLKDITHGQAVVVIGSLRYFNGEIYISPEIVKEQQPKYVLLRKIEIEKQRGATPYFNPKSDAPKPNAQKEEIKDKVIEMIKKSESEGGIETAELKKRLNAPSNETEQEIQKLLEEGTIFEPRPGKVRWLG